MAYLSLREVAQTWWLRPELLSTLTRVMADFEKATGKRTRVGDRGGVRLPETQAATYADSLAQGFRAAPPGQSHHEYGAAFDLVIEGTGKDAATDAKNPLYTTLAGIAEGYGLRAGLHFTKGRPDPYHFELKESLAVVRKKWVALTRERLWRAAALAAVTAGVLYLWHRSRAA